jgi:hypothetical protein
MIAIYTPRGSFDMDITEIRRKDLTKPLSKMGKTYTVVTQIPI